MKKLQQKVFLQKWNPQSMYFLMNNSCPKIFYLLLQFAASFPYVCCKSWKILFFSKNVHEIAVCDQKNIFNNNMKECAGHPFFICCCMLLQHPYWYAAKHKIAFFQQRIMKLLERVSINLMELFDHQRMHFQPFL